MVYLVSLHLSSRPTFWRAHDFEHIQNELMQGNWSHYIDSTWLIESDESKTNIRQRLGKWMRHKGDFLLIMDATYPVEGLLPADAWKWIKEHMEPKD